MALGGAVLELFAKLGLDSSQYDKGLEGAKSKFSGFASFLGGVGKVGAAAFAAVGTATVAMGKQAVDAYSNYEQLAGGIEKLFGESSNIVAQYAEQAFLTSGKSINEYMSSVTGIAASLKRSIGDDMDEVARVADVAMQVISDNVNTFGRDAEFVENAIMGLSRQNYMMIDNLSLGYAGTAQGMLELINDSGILGRTLTDTSELATVGFDKMILAIEEIQKQNGIAGATAKEALTTIEGAGKATRAAWQNVITAIGRGEGLGDALDGMLKAIFGVGKTEEGKETGLINQIIPRIKTVMEGIGKFVVQAGPLLAEKIPGILDAILPTVFETVTNLTASLGSFLFQKLPEIAVKLYEAVSQVVHSVSEFVLENLPVIIQSGVEMLNGLAQGMRESLPDLLVAAAEMIAELLAELVYELPDFIDAGINVVLGLIEGILSSIPSILDVIGDLVDKLWNFIVEFDWLTAGSSLITSITEGLYEKAPDILQAVVDLAMNIIDKFLSFEWLETGIKIIAAIITGLLNSVPTILSSLSQIITIAKNAIMNFDWRNLGKNIIDGIARGLSNAAGAIKDALLNAASNAWRAVKNFFGISSPSKLMRDTIGKFIPLGMAEGIEDESDSVFDAMDDLNSGAMDSFDTVFDDVSRAKISGLGGAINYGGLTFNIYGSEGQDVEEIAQAVKQIIIDQEERKRLVYA